jgi:hypothetical protein
MGRGSGDTLGRVEVEPGRDCCMSERFGGVCKEEKSANMAVIMHYLFEEGFQ